MIDLQSQPYFTSTASNVCFNWWSHDIGVCACYVVVCYVVVCNVVVCNVVVCYVVVWFVVVLFIAVCLLLFLMLFCWCRLLLLAMIVSLLLAITVVLQLVQHYLCVFLLPLKLKTPKSLFIIVILTLLFCFFHNFFLWDTIINKFT